MELLVVMMIVGILASLAAFALWDAQDSARAARTRAQVQKIHELLMIRWESYATRPVPIRTSRLPAELAAKARLNALRQLMRMELPDRITDISDGPAPVLSSPVVTMGTPSLSLAYQRRVDANGGFATWTAPNQQAECLYMILASIQDGTRNGLDFFRQNEIGDTDADGMPEIIDGWGQPIRFLRWAPGYRSDLQRIDQFELPVGQRTELRPDAFDPMRLDPRWKNNSSADRHFPSDQTPPYPDPATGTYDATLDDPFQLFPLVYSAGPDGLYHVLLDNYDPGAVTSGVLASDDYSPAGDYNGAAALSYIDTNTSAYAAYSPPTPDYPKPVWPTRDVDPSAGVLRLWDTAPRNDPYLILPSSGAGVRIGTQYGTGANDNIDNQSVAVR